MHIDAPLDLPLSYPVYVQSGLRHALYEVVQRVASAHRYAIIADAAVASHHASSLLDQFPADRRELFTVPSGEHEKTRARWGELTDALLTWGAGRDTTVIAFGGGVVGDLAGFVAATYMRGIPVVQLPTTLLAMVDASVGGKTAVDTPQGKNLVGAFHDPKAVVIDPALLATLPLPDLRSGLAEMIKHGVIADRLYFNAVTDALPSIAEQGSAAPALAELVRGSLRIKSQVVAEDHKEDARRHTLNFGHTIAHAIEQVLDYKILHGEAVAIGMIVEAQLAETLGIAELGIAGAVREAVRGARLPDSIPSNIDPAALIAATKGDKKNRAAEVGYSLPHQLGRMHKSNGSWTVFVPDSVVKTVLNRKKSED